MGRVMIERLQFELTSNGRGGKLNEEISLLCGGSEGSLEVAWSSLLPTIKVDPAFCELYIGG